MQSVVTATEFEAVLREPLALLYKHSDTCPISAMSLDEMDRLAAAHHGVPVYVLDVHAQRPLARYAAERLGVRHESPQIILLRGGTAIWHGSHYGVSANAIAAAIELAAGEPDELREVG
jgi:bacillithiol system protein YtxJ